MPEVLKTEMFLIEQLKAASGRKMAGKTDRLRLMMYWNG